MILLRVLGIVALLGVVSACVPMDSPDGAISSGILGERRSPDAAMEDNLLAMKLRSYYMRSDKVSASNINVSVYEGVVLLTGTAASQAEIDAALDIAKATRGVAKVHSELKVQHATMGELTKDAWYTSEVKARLLADEQVRGMDIHVETTKGTVYLTGTAQSVVERNRAIEIARMVKGVVEVVSYINVNERSQPLTPGGVEVKKADSPVSLPPVRMGTVAEPVKSPVVDGPGAPPVKPGTPVEGRF